MNSVIRPMSRSDKRYIEAWWASLDWIKKRRVMEICSQLSPSIMADNIEHMKQMRGREFHTRTTP